MKTKQRVMVGADVLRQPARRLRRVSVERAVGRLTAFTRPPPSPATREIRDELLLVFGSVLHLK
jgi:hypothetical protein